MAGMQAFVDALRASGQFDQLWSLFADHAERTIERRLTPVPPGRAASPVLVAHMLAGALVQSVQWWLDHQASATPHVVDAAFHQLAASCVRPA